MNNNKNNQLVNTEKNNTIVSVIELLFPAVYLFTRFTWATSRVPNASASLSSSTSSEITLHDPLVALLWRIDFSNIVEETIPPDLCCTLPSFHNYETQKDQIEKRRQCDWMLTHLLYIPWNWLWNHEAVTECDISLGEKVWCSFTNELSLNYNRKKK